MAAQITYLPPMPQNTGDAASDPNAPTNSGVADGRAQAAALAAANARLATAGLPAYDPNAAAVPVPQNPAYSPFYNAASNWFKGGQVSPAQQIAPTPLESLKHFFWDAAGSPEAQAYSQRQQAAATLTNPNVQAYGAANPGVASAMQAHPLETALKLGPILEALSSGSPPAPIVHPNGTVKMDSNPAHTAEIAKTLGSTPGHAHVLANAHEYSWPDFLAATQGINNAQLRMMWEMQHYLPPKEALGAGYIGGLQARAVHGDNAAQQMLDRLGQFSIAGQPVQ